MNTSAKLTTTMALSSESLLDVVLSSDDLPTLPTVASKLVTLTSKEDTTLSDVADLVSQDVALSSKILKVANSAFYSFPQQIGSVSQAVSMLGSNAVQSLVLSFSFLSMKGGRAAESAFDFTKFWERSLASAVVAKLILARVPGSDIENIFASALLQNLGELILACTMPEEYKNVLDDTTDASSHDSRGNEASVLGLDHCYIGYEVAKHWNFPLSILLPILHHHDPAEYVGDDDCVRQTIHAIYLSSFVLDIFYADHPEESHRRFEIEAVKLLGLKHKDIQQIMEEAHTALDQAAANFGLKIDEARSVQDILQEANIRLSLLNLDYDQVNKELVKAKLSLEKLTVELQDKNKLLEELADLDGLTGIYNNRFFQNALDSELSRIQRRRVPLSLVLCDIDHFKRFNDEYGHLVGDFVLTEFSRVMGENLREYDTLARYGGEEFVVVLPETTEEDAMIVAEKLRSAVASSVLREDGKEYRVTASYGVSTIHTTEENIPSKTELIRMADEALYDAKKKGRNVVCAYKVKKKWYKKN